MSNDRDPNAPQADPLAAIISRVQQTKDPHSYHIGLSDAEREMMQNAAFNFHREYGKKMKVPPRLFEDLKSKGVMMDHMVADKALEQ